MSSGHPLLPLVDGLLPAAVRTADSRGRRYPEPDHSFRGPFQRDRDRIIHSAAFRRLEYKTQVFVNGEGDHYRTRLTHTIEVSQIARSVARAVGLNEELAEAVALSHDLGHTPFGHAGERVLNSLLMEEGGFNHNFHGLRVVDILEKRYAAFTGLNLSYEVREAFIRHGGATAAAEAGEFAPGDAPLLEVAATLAADDIAYMAHDIDDGLYSGILDAGELAGQELWLRAVDMPGFEKLTPSLKRTEGVRRLINLLVTDLVASSKNSLERLKLNSVDGVRQCREAVIRFSDEVELHRQELRRFLFLNLYRHPNVVAVMEEVQKKLEALFELYVAKVEKLPPEYQSMAEREGEKRAAADYVAGMTDRFARDEYRKHFK
ncbi:MAG: deoxyguanosinetriphosphate triphosphohydrolase [Planctomycetes bacterium]|nr:deoxyguanosinetriphosphate triphosphohydrolase [Planctomycetota bacterium]